MAGSHVSKGTVQNRGVAKSPMRALNRNRATRPRAFRLTRTQETFCLEYLANGYNGSAAYKKTYPRCKSDGAARVEAHRLLTIPSVQRFLEVEQESRRERLRMEADEALALISIIARADVRDIFDDEGKVLPVHLWPDRIRLAVKSIRRGGAPSTIEAAAVAATGRMTKDSMDGCADPRICHRLRP